MRGRLSTSGITDAAFAARSCAGALDDVASFVTLLDGLDCEYNARTVSPRLKTVSKQMGRQLCRSAAAVWPHPALRATSALPGGCHQAIVLGVATAAAGGTPTDAATLTLHQMSAAVATATVRMLGLDPMVAAAVQAVVALEFDEMLLDADSWACADPADLPARSGIMTEVLAEEHGLRDARLFVA